MGDLEDHRGVNRIDWVHAGYLSHPSSNRSLKNTDLRPKMNINCLPTLLFMRIRGKGSSNCKNILKD